ncbi:MAG: hypothetical protein ACRCS6_06660, partial [Turicibacter sp.]
NNSLGTSIKVLRGEDQYHSTIPAGMIISYTRVGESLVSEEVIVTVSKGQEAPVTPPPVDPPVDPTPPVEPEPDPTPPPVDPPAPTCGVEGLPVCDENGNPIV